MVAGWPLVAQFPSRSLRIPTLLLYSSSPEDRRWCGPLVLASPHLSGPQILPGSKMPGKDRQDLTLGPKEPFLFYSFPILLYFSEQMQSADLSPWRWPELSWFKFHRRNSPWINPGKLNPAPHNLDIDLVCCNYSQINCWIFTWSDLTFMAANRMSFITQFKTVYCQNLEF